MLLPCKISFYNNKENTLKYIIASTCSHCLLKVTSLSNYIEYIFSEYSKNNLRLIRRLFPHQITYGQLSLLVNSLSLFWPIPKYAEASSSVKFAFSHNGIYFLSLTDEGREKAMDYINLLHASGMYEKQTAKIIPFRSIDIFENAVSARTGNFLVDGPKETVCIDESILPEDTTFGVRISGDSMEPEFHDGQIAWVLQQESVANGEIGIFALNGEAYIK